MVNFVPIGVDRLRDAVHAAFAYDRDLVDKYHVVNGDLDTCVDDTVRRIVEIKDELQYYALYCGKALIGFTVVGDSFLLSFGIGIFYRTADIVMNWWNQVCNMLGNEFVTWIFKKNTRTIRFLERQGMFICNDDTEKEFHNLIYILCPQEV